MKGANLMSNILYALMEETYSYPNSLEMYSNNNKQNILLQSVKQNKYIIDISDTLANIQGSIKESIIYYNQRNLIKNYISPYYQMNELDRNLPQILLQNKYLFQFEMNNKLEPDIVTLCGYYLLARIKGKMKPKNARDFKLLDPYENNLPDQIKFERDVKYVKDNIKSFITIDILKR